MGFVIFALRVLVSWFFMVLVRKVRPSSRWMMTPTYCFDSCPDGWSQSRKPGVASWESFWVVLRALEAAYREHKRPPASRYGGFTGGGDINFYGMKNGGIEMCLRPSRRKDRRSKAYTLSTRNPQTGRIGWDL